MQIRSFTTAFKLSSIILKNTGIKDVSSRYKYILNFKKAYSNLEGITKAVIRKKIIALHV